MPIVSTDIKYRLSGGGSNSDPAASLGGAMSSTEVTGSTLFDAVSSAEAAAGRVEYRCIYVLNTHATLTALANKLWLQANTGSADTTLDIGLGTSAVSGTEQIVANETTAPSGVTFSAAASEGAALSTGDLAAGAWKSVWLRRTTNAGAAGPLSETATLRNKCDTNP
jgi:hypothetical protein